jgi:hypothetical protein
MRLWGITIICLIKMILMFSQKSNSAWDGVSLKWDALWRRWVISRKSLTKAPTRMLKQCSLIQMADVYQESGHWDDAAVDLRAGEKELS